MPGTLIPPWFVDNAPTPDEFATASVIWGISLGLTIFAIIRATNQTYHQWIRKHKVTAYMVFIWLELVSSAIIGGTAWGYMRRDIPPRFVQLCLQQPLLLFLWFFQTHCILQIIINRIGLIALNKVFIHRLKWAVFIIVLIINIAVACIWIPSRLQISETYITINNYWDRAEKAVLAVIDLCLNVYFVYLVRSSLIAYGLTKYVRLYRFNLFMIAVSLSMDVRSSAFISIYPSHDN
uniref:Integral membrane protein n=1 Tax=Bionectria ochroleuca TaxID=29856 RepID=A0A0B7K1W7_BIOOC